MPIKFRSRLIEAARRAGVPVVPMALSYHGPGKDLASYAGDDDFVSHMTRLCQAPFIRGRVAVGTPIESTVAPAVIAREAQANVETMLEWVVSDASCRCVRRDASPQAAAADDGAATALERPLHHRRGPTGGGAAAGCGRPWAAARG